MLRLSLKLPRLQTTKVAYTSPMPTRHTYVDRPFPVTQPRARSRTPPPKESPQARTDICYNCDKPGHFAAQCAEPYRPRERRPSVFQLAGAKSRTYAPDGTCTRLSVLRIAGYGTAVLPSVAPPYSGLGSLFRLSFSSVSVLILWRRPRPAPPRLVRHLNLGVSLES